VWQLDSPDTNYFRYFAFSPDSRFLAASGHDGAVRVIEVGTPDEAPPRIRTRLRAMRIAWVPHTHILCIGGMDGLVHLWNLDIDRVDVVAPESGNIWALGVSPDGKTLAIGTQDGRLELFNLPSRRAIAGLRAHRTFIRDLAFAPDGRRLVSGGGDTWRIWEAFSSEE
jgi:WD40 repeat protein